MEQNQPSSLFEMQADSLMQSRLSSISKWGKFIAIVVLIMVALSAVFLVISHKEILTAFSSVMVFDSQTTGVLIAIAAISLALFIIWFVFLLRAAILIRQGLTSRNSDQLAEGFKALRVFFILSMIYSLLSILGTLSNFIN